MLTIHSTNYSFRKKWELFIQRIIQLGKNYSTKYSFKKFENYSFKIIIHFFEKLIIAQGYFRLNGIIRLSASETSIDFYQFWAVINPLPPRRVPELPQYQVNDQTKTVIQDLWNWSNSSFWAVNGNPILLKSILLRGLSVKN